MHLRRTVAVAATALLSLTACVPPADQEPDPGQGGADLAKLKVAKAGSMRGYSRDRFPHWRGTGPTCDVRDTVLERDGTGVQKRGCNVTGGRWYSVYDGKTLNRDEDVDIDHMIPLANAWRTGAADWDDQKRGDLANDLDRPQLIAVSATSNRSKGDQDPAQWKPPRRQSWCTYAVDWIAVKKHWELTVTEAEKTALADMLETCV